MAIPTYWENNAVTRTIHFYRVDAGTTAGGVPLMFDPYPILKHLKGLDYDHEGNYYPFEEGRDACCWVDDLEKPCKIRFATVRRTDFPQVEHVGDLSPLDLHVEAGLAELIHIICFPDNVLGAEYNHFGPRVSLFAQYLNKKIPELGRVISIDPLMRREASGQLKQLDHISMLDLKIKSSHVSLIREANQSLAQAFEAASRAGDAAEVRIILRPDPRKRGWLADGLFDTIRTLSRSEALTEESARFVIRGHNAEHNRIDEINLLNDLIVSRRRIMRIEGRTRALDAGSAYAAIEAAYAELRDEIRFAAQIQGNTAYA